jgi:hypothetical protein
MGSFPMTFPCLSHGLSAFISKPTTANTALTSSRLSSFPVSQARWRLGHGFVLMHMNRSGRTVSRVSFHSAGMAKRSACDSIRSVTLSSAERTTKKAVAARTRITPKTSQNLRFTGSPIRPFSVSLALSAQPAGRYAVASRGMPWLSTSITST